VLQVLFACARTGQFVPTGIETDLDTFIALPEVLDQKRDLDFRFAAQISRGPSRGFCPPPLLNRGLDVAS
jgi:hypothetical protein